MTEFDQEFKKPSLTLGAELTDDDFGEFLGVIMNDGWEPNTKQGGAQYAFAVKPVDFEIQGKTGMFHHWYNPTTKSNSKMALLLTGFRQAGYDPTLPLGEGKLVGTVGWFIRKTVTFGKDKTTGEEIKAEGVIIPTRLASEEEIARARGEETPSSSATLEWNRGQVDAVLDAIVGHSTKEVQRIAARSSLEPELKAALLRGTAIRYLQENGVIEIDESGVIQSLVAA